VDKKRHHFESFAALRLELYNRPKSEVKSELEVMSELLQAWQVKSELYMKSENEDGDGDEDEDEGETLHDEDSAGDQVISSEDEPAVTNQLAVINLQPNQLVDGQFPPASP